MEKFSIPQTEDMFGFQHTETNKPKKQRRIRAPVNRKKLVYGLKVVQDNFELASDWDLGPNDPRQKEDFQWSQLGMEFAHAKMLGLGLRETFSDSRVSFENLDQFFLWVFKPILPTEKCYYFSFQLCCMVGTLPNHLLHGWTPKSLDELQDSITDPVDPKAMQKLIALQMKKNLANYQPCEGIMEWYNDNNNM